MQVSYHLVPFCPFPLRLYVSPLPFHQSFPPSSFPYSCLLPSQRLSPSTLTLPLPLLPNRLVTSAFLRRLSSSWPCLPSFTLHGSVTPWRNLNRGWGYFKHLKSITFIDCPSTVLDALQSIIKCCPRLKCVRCNSHSFAREHLLAIVTSGQSFEELSLKHCYQIDDSAVHYVCQISSTALDHLSSLQVLNLDHWTRLSDRGILPILKACTNLKCLDISGNWFTDRTGLYIGQHLLGLERLSIIWCDRMTDESLLSFAGLKNLRQLYLQQSFWKRGSRFTSKGLKMFFLQLAANKDSEPGTHGLDTLEVSKFNDDIDSPLLVLGQKFPGLRHLDISRCSELTDVGLGALAQHCQSLVTLKVNYEKCPHYKTILRTAFPQLRYLNLQSSDLLDDAELQQLKKARPWLEISFARN